MFRGDPIRARFRYRQVPAERNNYLRHGSFYQRPLLLAVDDQLFMGSPGKTKC